MKPVYQADYAALSPEEKPRLVYDLGKNARASFQREPYERQPLAQALSFTRRWSSSQHMSPQKPAPDIPGQAIELLWDDLEGRCSNPKSAAFPLSPTLIPENPSPIGSEGPAGTL